MRKWTTSLVTALASSYTHLQFMLTCMINQWRCASETSVADSIASACTVTWVISSQWDLVRRKETGFLVLLWVWRRKTDSMHFWKFHICDLQSTIISIFARLPHSAGISKIWQDKGWTRMLISIDSNCSNVIGRSRWKYLCGV